MQVVGQQTFLRMQYLIELLGTSDETGTNPHTAIQFDVTFTALERPRRPSATPFFIWTKKYLVQVVGQQIFLRMQYLIELAVGGHQTRQEPTLTQQFSSM